MLGDRSVRLDGSGMMRELPSGRGSTIARGRGSQMTSAWWLLVALVGGGCAGILPRVFVHTLPLTEQRPVDTFNGLAGCSDFNSDSTDHPSALLYGGSYPVKMREQYVFVSEEVKRGIEESKLNKKAYEFADWIVDGLPHCKPGDHQLVHRYEEDGMPVLECTRCSYSLPR